MRKRFSACLKQRRTGCIVTFPGKCSLLRKIRMPNRRNPSPARRSAGLFTFNGRAASARTRAGAAIQITVSEQSASHLQIELGFELA